MNLLPHPRSVVRHGGFLTLPASGVLHLSADLPRDSVLLPIAERVQEEAARLGVRLQITTGAASRPAPLIQAQIGRAAPDHPQGYSLQIGPHGITVNYRQVAGLRAAAATLRQLLREYGRRLPRLMIRDYPDFERRGVMLDISRGRVPKLETLFALVEHLADFKINEFQLYTEHTFAYRNYEPVWRDWGAIAGEEILRLDARCRQLGIDLVPNQNSFGHLRYWFEHAPLRKLAEIAEPYEGADGTYLRYPTTLAPNNPGTLPFLRELFDELLPHFTSERFNAGCDETWDLGRGQSKAVCQRRGKGRVYLEFLKKIHHEAARRGCRMMFWGDIILHHPELIADLPREVIALNWGYEAGHPFEREAARFAESQIAFYVCPGTSTWMSLVGRHDNALANLREAAAAGRRHGALGFLITDWGDGGHPQPLAVSYLPFLAGAALSWCAKSFDEKALVPALSRDVFLDPSQSAAKAALALGLAHRQLNHYAPNTTPLGAVIAAPAPGTREIPCRDGLKYYARINPEKIRAAQEALKAARRVLHLAQPRADSGKLLASELDLAARMASHSCHIMLWQQALAAGAALRASQMAKAGTRDLLELDREFRSYWPSRNKGTTAKCSAFLQWRMEDYRRGILRFPPELARVVQQKSYAAE